MTKPPKTPTIISAYTLPLLCAHTCTRARHSAVRRIHQFRVASCCAMTLCDVTRRAMHAMRTARAHMHVCASIRKCIHAHTHASTRMHAHMHTHACSYMRSYMHACLHASMHTHVLHMQTHTGDLWSTSCRPIPANSRWLWHRSSLWPVRGGVVAWVWVWVLANPHQPTDPSCTSTTAATTRLLLLTILCSHSHTEAMRAMRTLCLVPQSHCLILCSLSQPHCLTENARPIDSIVRT